MWHDLRASYRGVRGIFAQYWKAYGGWKAVLTSPYLHGSVVLTPILGHLWFDASWWTDAIASLPTMIGFAIGAYAIVLGFGDERFRAILTQRRGGRTSPYVTISASLAHFIVVQLAALICAFLAKGLDFYVCDSHILSAILLPILGGCDVVHDWFAPIGNFVGFTLFVYAIATALATAMAIFRLTTLVEREELPKPTENVVSKDKDGDRQA
ncbi:hypothetical protein [Paraburkholderia sediminicola]|uniref:hypothetical protein n=1 Tax=Paraburkholderia sediminicola TaxID=458836 RepID=UPI0038BD1301